MEEAGRPLIAPYPFDEEGLAMTRRDGKPRLCVYRPEGRFVVLGSGSKPEREIHEDACLRDRVPILKRRGGGCAVVLDEGNVIVSFFAPLEGYGGNRAHFARLSGWVIEGLGRVGVPSVRREGVSDLALGDRKVGGACIYRSKGLLFYSTTLLVAPDLDAVERYLMHPPREPAYRKGRPHREFMGSLSPRPYPGSAPTLAAALGEVLDPTRALGNE